jgi:hypothetical protein
MLRGVSELMGSPFGGTLVADTGCGREEAPVPDGCGGCVRTGRFCDGTEVPPGESVDRTRRFEDRSPIGSAFAAPSGPDGEATMKDIRCLVGYHDYVKKQIEDSQYLRCRRCGTDDPTKPGDAGAG